MALFSTEAKPASNWYVAATHYLTGGLVAPGIISAVIAYALNSIVKIGNVNFVVDTILGALLSMLSLWLGIIYSQNYIRKHYIMRDVNKVINISAIFYFVGSLIILAAFYALGIIYLIAVGLGHSECEVTQFCDPKNSIMSYSVLTIIETYIFYILSKKYLSSPNTNNL